MFGLSGHQWKVLIFALPTVIAEVKTALPVLIPLIKHAIAAWPTIIRLINLVAKIIEDAELHKPEVKSILTYSPGEILEQPHGMTPEERELFERMSRIE